MQMSLQRCMAPAAFQSARGGQRYCGRCLDAQLAEAGSRMAAARRDTTRLSSLQPIARPFVRKAAP
jgi:hypothetical protein